MSVEHEEAHRAPAQFATTRWSLVADARDGSTSVARAALEELCHAYWYPLYAHIRARGPSATDAQDLAQEFFARLLRDGSFAAAQQERGRLRSFLLGALKHFLADAHDRATAAKRGGGERPLELDALDAEQRFALEPTDGDTPDRAFDRRWASLLAERALGRLGEELVAEGKSAQWELLRPLLGREVERGEYEALSPTLGLSSNAIAATVRRLRQRARNLMLDEAAQTVRTPAEAEAELRALFS